MRNGTLYKSSAVKSKRLIKIIDGTVAAKCQISAKKKKKKKKEKKRNKRKKYQRPWANITPLSDLS